MIEGGDYGNFGYEVGGSCGAGAAGIAPLTGTLVNHGAVLGGSGGGGTAIKATMSADQGAAPLASSSLSKGEMHAPLASPGH